MMQKKECVAMLLAGGQGSRLGALTRRIAKPAVSFGGKYRIIDFSLSNCVNSGIDTVGVLVQYRPMILSRYLGTGEAWDLDVSTGGVHILPPYSTEVGASWYNGTADAIYHNVDFIDSYDPEYVLILSGDHLYEMDYKKMLDYHKANKADLTVSVIGVPMEEASRFGIMSVDEGDKITRFTEKPKNPDSNLASMGIYIFSWPVLKKALNADHENKSSDNDFGKDIIPMLLSEGKRLFAYRFEGYWKDVGTIESYFDAQMDLMRPGSGFDIVNGDMVVFSNPSIDPPHYISPTGQVTGSMVCNGCVVKGKVRDSILSSGSKVAKGALIKDCILLPNSSVGENCRITKAIINEGVAVKAGSTIKGEDGKIAVIGAASEFAERR